MSEESVKDGPSAGASTEATADQPGSTSASRPDAPAPSRPSASRPALKANRVIKLGQSSPPSRPRSDAPAARSSAPPPVPIRSTPPIVSPAPSSPPPVRPIAPPFHAPAPPAPELESVDDDAPVTAASSSLPPKVYSSAPPIDGAKRASTSSASPKTPLPVRPPPAPPLRSSTPPHASTSDVPIPTSAPTLSYGEEEITVEEELSVEASEDSGSRSEPPFPPPSPPIPGSLALDPLSPVIPKAPALGMNAPDLPVAAPVHAEQGPSDSNPGGMTAGAAPPPPSMAAKLPQAASGGPRRMPVPPSIVESDEIELEEPDEEHLDVDVEVGAEENEPQHDFEVPAAERKPPPPRRPGKPSLPQVKKPRPKPWWETLFGDDFQRAYRPMSSHQVKREVDFIVESFQLPRGSVLLDLGCGQGELCIELTRRGYSVVGYDLSVYQLAMAGDLAQQAGQKINFLQGDMREMAFDNMFDGILCWDTTFGYFEEDKNLEVLRRMKQALKPGGRLILDILNRDFVGQQAPYSHWFEGDGCVCMDDMNMDWITNRLKVKRSIILDDGRSKELQYSIRLYSLSEIGRMLHEAGFRVAAISGGVATRGAFFGPVSRRIIIEANKP